MASVLGWTLGVVICCVALIQGGQCDMNHTDDDISMMGSATYDLDNDTFVGNESSDSNSTMPTEETTADNESNVSISTMTTEETSAGNESNDSNSTMTIEETTVGEAPVTTPSSPFSGLDTGALVGISLGCVLMFFVCLTAVYVLFQTKFRQEATYLDKKRLRQEMKLEASERISSRHPSSTSTIDTWASSPTSTTTAVSLDDPWPVKDGPAWSEEADVEECDFTDDCTGRVVVNNTVMITGEDRQPRSKGKNVRARDRAREMRAERGTSQTALMPASSTDRGGFSV